MSCCTGRARRWLTSSGLDAFGIQWLIWWPKGFRVMRHTRVVYPYISWWSSYKAMWVWSLIFSSCLRRPGGVRFLLSWLHMDELAGSWSWFRLGLLLPVGVGLETIVIIRRSLCLGRAQRGWGKRHEFKQGFRWRWGVNGLFDLNSDHMIQAIFKPVIKLGRVYSRNCLIPQMRFFV